jgi:DNA-binding GntR family transcriptional regulator
MGEPNLRLQLDRERPETLRQQAVREMEAAIRAARPGFRRGERLTTLGLARANPLHRNTLALAMEDLIQLGYLRRVPNRGFEVVDRTPTRPASLTRHALSLSEIAGRSSLAARSELLEAACGQRRVARLSGRLRQACQELDLRPTDAVWMLSRSRQMRRSRESAWSCVAVEQTLAPISMLPTFLEDARQSIQLTGDFSMVRYLRNVFPDDTFFKTHYEISLTPIPASLGVPGAFHSPPVNVLAVTYGATGPLELTSIWFDSARATLLAGSLDVRVD